MPLPHPPGYRQGRQRRVDRRRIALAALLACLGSALLLALHHRAAALPGETLPPIHPWAALALVAAAGAGAAYGETMRQLTLIQLGREREGPQRLG
jgi:hypothetical protein